MGVPNRLGMKDWVVLETQEDAYNMRVVAGKPVQPEVCPRCGVENPRVYKHDQQEQTFMDTPMTDIERCNFEISEADRLLRAGHPEVHGLMQCKYDWHVEKRLIELEAECSPTS